MDPAVFRCRPRDIVVHLRFHGITKSRVGEFQMALRNRPDHDNAPLMMKKKKGDFTSTKLQSFKN